MINPIQNQYPLGASNIFNSTCVALSFYRPSTMLRTSPLGSACRMFPIKVCRSDKLRACHPEPIRQAQGKRSRGICFLLQIPRFRGGYRSTRNDMLCNFIYRWLFQIKGRRVKSAIGELRDKPQKGWVMRDSNPRPSRCKRDALTN